MNDKKLFSDFEETTTKSWEAIIHKDLKGADYSKKLITQSFENIPIKPYYRIENNDTLSYLNSNPNEFPFLRGNISKPRSHKIRQNILVTNYIDTNSKAIKLISSGVTSFGINLSQKNNFSLSDLSSLIKDIDLSRIQINFICGKNYLQITKVVKDFLSSTVFHNIDFSIDFDPLGHYSISNFLPTNYKDDLKSLFNQSKQINGFKVINVNTSIFRNAGSSAVQELAYGLSIANDYLSIANDFNFNIDAFASKIMFTFGIGSNYFFEISKLRAVRVLWSKILEAYGIKDFNSAKMNICSVTSDWNKTAYDPYVNVLRTTTEAMSAIIGGTDSLLVNPFNSSYEEPNEFSERIARNIQIILNEEAYFDKFIDPSGGSFYIENITNSIIENVWDLFLKVQKEGTYHSAFDKGIITSDIQETASKRDMAIAMKTEILLGTNQYAATNEILDFTLPIRNNAENTLKLYRGAEAFEKLRQKTENAKKRPVVLLLIFGNLTMRKARASFASNFFACAGFKIIENDVVTSADEAIKQVKLSNADITVLCSSDDEYLSFSSELYKSIRDETIITIAGYPKKHIEALHNVGIENFIHVKSNILETLINFQNTILK